MGTQTQISVIGGQGTDLVLYLPYTGERVVPWVPAVGPRVLVHHVYRYTWALGWVWGRDVVDLACGTGYGSLLLSWAANRVLGVDMDYHAIMYAEAAFGKAPGLSFEEANLEQWVAPPGFDLGVAFEIIEHMDRPEALFGLGLPFAWSIPLNDGSKYHKRTYNMTQAAALMGSVDYVQFHDGTIERYRPGTHKERPTHAMGIWGP